MRCPFADWEPASSDGGSYTGGPFRIVLHTTENSTTEGADAELHQHYASHFIVGADRIIQLIDTERAGKALQHHGDPETNRLSAVQNEMVGFAGRRKNPAMLANARKLNLWLMKQHGVPSVWPNGHCVPAINGQDSNHHNRNPLIWATHGGFYGHEHVPENFHWDPALQIDEQNYVDGTTSSIGGIIVPPPKTYTVVAGDTIWKISTYFGLTPGALESLNDLKAPFIIKPKQVLKVAV